MYVKKVHFILSLLIILLGYSNATNLIGFNISSDKNTAPEFTVMSFNVRLFNQYNWLEDTNTRENIYAYIAKEAPDVIAFQEFFESKKNRNANKKRLKNLGYIYSVQEPNPNRSSKTDFFGLTLFSKYKLKDHGIAYRRLKGEKTISYFIDIEIKDERVRVYNTHLNSLGFQSEDYKFVENLSENTEAEALQKSKNILSKVMIAAKKRQLEVEGIINHISSSPYPVIVLGDFNEPPYSYAYPQFTTELIDPFQKFGFGLGTTFDGITTLPSLRLDYILHSERLTSVSYKTGPKKLSDHRPITSGFVFSK
jgi:endonuclease/exonuclease/phosphatase family metal-dependent hydrolase